MIGLRIGAGAIAVTAWTISATNNSASITHR